METLSLSLFACSCIHEGVVFFADQLFLAETGTGGFSICSSAPGAFFIQAGVCLLAAQDFVVGTDGGFSAAGSASCLDLTQDGAGDAERRRGEDGAISFSASSATGICLVPLVVTGLGMEGDCEKCLGIGAGLAVIFCGVSFASLLVGFIQDLLIDCLFGDDAGACCCGSKAPDEEDRLAHMGATACFLADHALAFGTFALAPPGADSTSDTCDGDGETGQTSSCRGGTGTCPEKVGFFTTGEAFQLLAVDGMGKELT